MMTDKSSIKGRGSTLKPPNRFESIHVEDDWQDLEYDDEFHQQQRSIKTEYFDDHAKTVLSKNDSPDISFRYSLNPYRGCLHGCSYCYARPTHEYLGYNAGIDFETKVLVKQDAPRLFRDALAKSSWQAQTVVLSGVTDCYQPAERKFRLTRQCLEVALEARQPMAIITKNAMVLRDLDILREMAAMQLVSVAISVTTLDASLARVMEPRTSSPTARLRAISQLSAAGIPTTIMVAPVIPGLNDSEIPAILSEGRRCGAQHAGYVLLRLPHTVKPVFFDWLERTFPDRRAKIESLIRSTRDGNLYNADFKQRMQGSGEIANQIRQTFDVFARKVGLDRKMAELDASQFHPPRSSTGQLRLF